MDLWVRIPHFQTELINFDSIANLLAANDVGALMKVDQRSLLRNKIRYSRACIRVDIQGPLLEFPELSRVGDLVLGYIIWYENFSSGCSFCGDFVHLIDACPLLNSPKKVVTMQLIENTKQKSLFQALAKAVGQELHASTAKKAKVVHVQSKHLGKKASKPAAVPFKKYLEVWVRVFCLINPVTKGVVIVEPAVDVHVVPK